MKLTKEQGYKNTDRELWREREGDYYADSIHVTEQGNIGIDCGGTVIVKPVREWHRLASLSVEPVAVVENHPTAGDGVMHCVKWTAGPPTIGTKLYAAPPEREVSAEPVRRQCGYCHSWISRNCGEGCMRDPVKDPTEAMLDSEREGLVSVPREPDVGSKDINNACLVLLESLPDGATVSPALWNNFKPAFHQALCGWIASQNASAPQGNKAEMSSSDSSGSLPNTPGPAAATLQQSVYAWLGFWRDKMPAEAVTALQDILGPLLIDV